MSDKPLLATAKVQLVIEVTVGSNWGADCSIDQVFSQASEEAIGAVTRMIEQAQRVGRGIRIVGELKVKSVLAERGSS